MVMTLILIAIDILKVVFGKTKKCDNCGRKRLWLSQDNLCQLCMVEHAIDVALEAGEEEPRDWFAKDDMDWKVLGVDEGSTFPIVFSEDEESALLIGAMPPEGSGKKVKWKKLGIG